jgi:hypothetical protein
MKSFSWTHCRMAAASLAVVIGGLALSQAALAQRPGRPAGHAWHGDIARFHDHDWGVWRGGHWVRQRHDGRLGWWWVAGGMWYFYPSPVYPYPNPWEPSPAAVLVSPPVPVAPPPTQYWYYCEPAKAYYPYVATCPAPWQQVAATPATAGTPPAVK